MARKKQDGQNKGSKAADRRWGTVESQELLDQAERLIAAAEKLKGLPLVMRALGVEGRVRIDGATKFRRGIEQIELYVEKVEEGVVKERGRMSRIKV